MSKIQTKTTIATPATREILACVGKEDSQDMEVVEGRKPKRKNAARRSWRNIHDSLSRQRQHPSAPENPAVTQKTQSRAEAKPPPVPRSDYKIIVRVRGGLKCAANHPCTLSQIILKASGLSISDRTSSDQIRVNTVNHAVLINTPDMGRVDLYHNIKNLQFNGTPHEVATHVANPVDTCRGSIRLPPDYSEDDIASTPHSCNPTLTIGSARRLCNTETILVIFQGKIIHFYVNYDGCSLRCRPIRQKVGACTRCHEIGHHQDVCTNDTETLCPKCGMKDAPMHHECHPICVAQTKHFIHQPDFQSRPHSRLKSAKKSQQKQGTRASLRKPRRRLANPITKPSSRQLLAQTTPGKLG
ncbi:hypothetical protein HPB49_009421 [Dermacentor silvarum]|uniref:Uncharacterized protein n=1 Tax=Dermacentor silvarum TaxID=543639 RepID=A0ACB8D4C5_DERSI|nr:hypothetical protein HPB49_009421 [Dermacentor silvarum]